MQQYRVTTTSGDLEPYTFQINGVLALRNYNASVHKGRVKITSNDNAALSILECETSEVEIDGRVYSTPEDAQRALNQIVYANTPIVPISREDYKRLLFKLTADDVNAKKILLADGSLTDPTDTSNLLEKGTFEGTAEDLKKAIDNITQLIHSDDTSLDEIQEIVNFIKQNKEDLQNLTIENIAGLKDIVNSFEAGINALNTAISNKADRSHRHSVSDINGLPTDIATERFVAQKIQEINEGYSDPLTAYINNL